MIKVKNQGEGAEIYIHGDIVDDSDGLWREECDFKTGYEWPNDLKKKLDECKGKDLTVYINSDGGSVPAGVAMANMIARHDGNTTAIVDGWCCSIATQIFFAAKNRKMPENAYLMVHKPSCGVFGNSDDMKRTAQALDCIQEGLEATYRGAAKEGTTDEEISEMVNKETWLTGAEAAEKFNIELMPASTAVAKASKNGPAMKNIPEAIRVEAVVNKVDRTDAADDKTKQENEVAIVLAMAEGELV